MDALRFVPAMDFHVNRTGMHACSLTNTTATFGLQAHFKYQIYSAFNLSNIKGFREYDSFK